MPETERSTEAIKVTAAGDTFIGRRRYNEDAILLRPDLELFLLADGAGGHNAGNVASALATTAVAHYFEETNDMVAAAPRFDDLGLSTAARRLAAAVQRANHEVIEVAKSSRRYRGMGTTLVAVHVQADAGVVHVAHVGDSRCYRLRAGRLELLTHDHTLLNDVLELRPDLPGAEAAKLPRNVITRALGMSGSVRVAVRSHEIVPGDRYLLCSDGVTGVIADDRIADAFTHERKPEAQVRVLMDMIRAQADDNVAALAIACDLAPGVTTLPRRAQLRPKPVPRTASPEARASTRPASDEDYPEIIILEEGLHVVPAESAGSFQKSAVRDVMQRPSSPPRPPDADT